jgi:hypothetical protein
VPALVSERTNQLKVFDPVVDLVSVAMMDLVSVRDWAVELLPNKNVFHSEA